MARKQKVQRKQRLAPNTGLQLKPIEPITENQSKVFRSNKNLVLSGSAGVGKTFLALGIGLEEVLAGRYSRLVIIRSNVETRKMGFLPGNEKEKMEVYEAPYIDIASELFENGSAYSTLKTKGVVHFMPTSFIRGRTLDEAFIVIDEAQNMTYHELDSVITRVGKNSRVIFCGDYFQSDLPDSGLVPFFRTLKSMNEFDFIEFTTDDIVRSDFVKNYLITKYAVHGDRQRPS